MLFKNQKLDYRFYSEITESQAKRLYRNGETVYVSNGTITSPINIRHDAYFPNISGMRFYMERNYDSNDIIVTRHENVEKYFRKHGLAHAPCIKDMRDYEFKGKNIYCASVPLKMASYASKVTCINLDNSLNLNLDLLSYEEFEKYVKSCTTFEVSSSKWNEKGE